MGDPGNGTGQRRAASLAKGLKEYALKIISSSLEDVRTQSPLDPGVLHSFERPTLGDAVPVAMYRTVRLLALREVLGAKISSAVMRVSGRSIAQRMAVDTIPGLIETMRDMGVGLVVVEEQTDDGITLRCDECATCSGLPNIGEAVCAFESGLIEWTAESVYGRSTPVVETHCWGLGDGLCRWTARRELDSDLAMRDSVDPVEVVIGLAGKAASAVDAAIAIRQKNRELREAYHQIRESEKLKRDLTDMVVHDMRLPLTAIIGSMEMLADSAKPKLGPQEAEMLRLALTSGRSLLNMTDDLLDISKLEERRIVLRKQPTRIGYLVEEAINQVEILMRRKKLSLGVELAQSLPEIPVDRERVVRIIANLLNNAARHTPTGGSVTVGAVYDGPADMVRISVRDSGEGIPKEYHRVIFDKFVQVETGRSTKRTSSGLGLTFCKLATEAHGGSISLQSKVGVGSTFTVSLPASSEQAEG